MSFLSMSKQKMEQFGLMEVVFFIVKTSAIADKNVSDKCLRIKLSFMSRFSSSDLWPNEMHL